LAHTCAPFLDEADSHWQTYVYSSFLSYLSIDKGQELLALLVVVVTICEVVCVVAFEAEFLDRALGCSRDFLFFLFPYLNLLGAFPDLFSTSFVLIIFIAFGCWFWIFIVKHYLFSL
jgi:hypothetical protein